MMKHVHPVDSLPKNHHVTELLLLAACKAATCLKRFRALNIMSVHSMQVSPAFAEPRTNMLEIRAMSFESCLMKHVHPQSTLSWPRWMFTPLASTRENMLFLLGRPKISHITYLKLCQIKRLDYIMRMQKQNARCPILFVRAWPEWRLSCFD